MISDNSRGVRRATDKSGGTKPNSSTGEPKTTERHHKLGDPESRQMSTTTASASAGNSTKRPRAQGDGDLDDPTNRAAKAPRLTRLPCDEDEDDEISSDGIESRVDGVEESITYITATPIAGGNVIVTIPGRNGDPPSLTELRKAGFEAFKTSQGVFGHHTIRDNLRRMATATKLIG